MDHKEKDLNVYKDYTDKILYKLDNEFLYPENVNDFVNLLNYSFKTRNDFFVENFNKRLLKEIYLGYNTLKTNILTPEIKCIFGNIKKSQLKLFKFIMSNFVNNYTAIIKNNPDLCIKKESIKNCIISINAIL